MAASETVQRLEQQAAEAGRLQVVNQLLLDESARQRLQELRKRLGEPWLILTVPGVGYRIGADADA